MKSSEELEQEREQERERAREAKRLREQEALENRLRPSNILYLLTHNRVAQPFQRRRKRIKRWFRKTRRVRRQRRAVGVGSRLLFLRRELRGQDGQVNTYRLRRTRTRAKIRHRTDDKDVVEEIFLEHNYAPPEQVRNTLGESPRVVGLGGHIGLFGLYVLRRWPKSTLVEFEPDPDNARLLRRNRELNRLGDRWELIEAFAGTAEGARELFRGHGTALSRLAVDGIEYEGEVIEVRAVDVFPYLAEADLIKMDIEGGEWEILADPRFRDLRAQAIVLEHHHQLCPADSPRREATDRLEAAGYEVIPLWMKENGVGMVWGVRT